MRIHGQYCGPNWSAGKHQASVINGEVAPDDFVDAGCREHDTGYGLAERTGMLSFRSNADWDYVNKHFGRSYLGSVIGTGLMAQDLVRQFVGYDFSGSLPGKKRKVSEAVLFDSIDKDMARKKTKKAVKRASTTSKKRYSRKTKRTKKRKYSGMKKKYRTKRVYKKKAKATIKEVTEVRGVITDTRAIYLGHSVAGGRVIKMWIRCIVKELGRQAGNHVDDFAKPIPVDPPYRIWIRYRESPTSDTVQTSNLAMVLNETWEQMCDRIRTELQNIKTAYPEALFEHIALNDTSAGGVGQVQRVAHINLQEFRMNLLISSHLKVQNETRGVAGQDEYDAEAVTRNPLMHRGYKKMLQNGFTPKVSPGTEVGYEGFHSQGQNGLILATAAFTLNRYSRKLLPHDIFVCKKHGNGVIQPGQIKRDILKMSLSLSTNKVWTAFEKYWLNPTSNDAEVMPYTKGVAAQMIGFEKVVDTGRVANLAIGYELEQFYAAKYSLRPKQYTAPILNV